MTEHETLSIAVLQQGISRLKRQRRSLFLRCGRSIASQKEIVRRHMATGEREKETFHRGQLRAFEKMAEWFE